MPRAVYDSLLRPNTIRLLKLALGAPYELLHALVHVVALSKALDCVAISYAWVDSTKTKVLQTQHGDYSITSSLYCALSNVRDSDQHLWVWADAVCINQDDNSEKAKQVRLMGKIYSRARLVAVDLGEKLAATKDIGRVIVLLYALARISELPLEPCSAKLEKGYLIMYEDYEKYSLPSMSDRA